MLLKSLKNLTKRVLIQKGYSRKGLIEECYRSIIKRYFFLFSDPFFPPMRLGIAQDNSLNLGKSPEFILQFPNCASLLWKITRTEIRQGTGPFPGRRCHRVAYSCSNPTWGVMHVHLFLSSSQIYLFNLKIRVQVFVLF